MFEEKGESEKTTKREEKSRERRGIYRNLTLISQFTLFMLVPIGGLSALGYFLDKHFGTSWIIIVCFFVGAVAGGQSVYRLAMKIANEKKEEPERNIINPRGSGNNPKPDDGDDEAVRTKDVPDAVSEKSDD